MAALQMLTDDCSKECWKCKLAAHKPAEEVRNNRIRGKRAGEQMRPSAYLVYSEIPDGNHSIQSGIP
jgi:hypothetical protein